MTDKKYLLSAKYFSDIGQRKGALCAFLLPALLLLPFITKAFHIDDTVYLYVAQHIQQHPLDFFGFQMNWDSDLKWVYDFNKNPPAFSYYLALVALVVGWSEPAMHLAVLPFSMFASLGIYRLASLYCDRPLLATAISVLTPNFLIASSNVMCEPMVLCLYVWALYCWIQGMNTQRNHLFLISVLLITLATLTKYIAITALPLVLVYSLMRDRKFTVKLVYCLIPIVALLLFDLYSYKLYQKSMLSEVAQFSLSHPPAANPRSLGQEFGVGLAFLGGCFITVGLCALCWLPKRNLLGVAGLALFVLAWLAITFGFESTYKLADAPYFRYSPCLHAALFITLGLYLLSLTVQQLRRSPSPDSTLIFLLVMGIFVFSTFVNWTTNGRALLFITPALGIIVVRLSKSTLDDPKPWIWLPVGASAVISLATCYGDYAYAAVGRNAAEHFKPLMAESTGTVYFVGNWGFQYYMEEAGAIAINRSAVSEISKGIIFAVDLDVPAMGFQTNDLVIGRQTQLPFTLPDLYTQDYEEHSVLNPTRISLMSIDLDSGYYASIYGDLPYRLIQEPQSEIFYSYTIVLPETPYPHTPSLQSIKARAIIDGI